MPPVTLTTGLDSHDNEEREAAEHPKAPWRVGVGFQGKGEGLRVTSSFPELR